jgi:hypothetical protein
MELAFKGTDTTGLLVLAFTIIVLIYVHQHLRTEYGPCEPPVIWHRVPYAGHVIGMLRYGGSYLEVVKLVAIESTSW